MKTKRLIAQFATLLLSLLLAPHSLAEISHVHITIDGLGCPFCVYGIEKQLKKIDGVQDVDLDLKTGLALVTLRNGSSPNLSTFHKAVKNSGFTPRTVQITAIGHVQRTGDGLFLLLRRSHERYRILLGVSPALSAEPAMQLADFAQSQSLVAVTGVLKSHGNEGFLVEKVSPVTTVELSVEGMACEKCSARLRRLVEARDEVYQALIHFSENRATIEGIGQALEVSHLIQLVTDAGFSASIVNSEGPEQ